MDDDDSKFSIDHPLSYSRSRSLITKLNISYTSPYSLIQKVGSSDP